MPKAIIFDIDGTLIDSVDAHAQAWCDTLAEFGHPVSFGDVRGQIGKGGDQLMPVYLSPLEVEFQGDAIGQFRSNLFQSRYLDTLKPFPQVRALFERLTADGIRIALASSAKGDELDAYKRIAGIEDLIHLEVSFDDAEKSKPAPDIFQAALRRLGNIPPADILAVGDAPYDAEAAGKAGLRTIGVLCGGFPEADLRAAGCIAIYDSPTDLLARYETLPR
jgi:HAD superfamily hydrolase (TIGR01509 family)